MRVLAINPGSTSTKVAVFDDETPVFDETLRHTTEELAPFPHIADQYEFRRDVVLRFLEEQGIGFKTGVTRVPIVPAAILFDLNVGRPDVRPDAEMGYRAASAASARRCPRAARSAPPKRR